jgi:predicted SnoaL-like aldol condensation-catalyzing enzyme
MTNYIWGNLGRAVNDNTLIDQAIANAVQAHGDDPDAHLATGQALTTHRAAEIIDHLAESVVNDKLHHSARAYSAIVGSGVDGDYDTIQAAIEYVAGVGGGTILVLPGAYYLAGAVALPVSINIVGLDAESTTIHGGFTATNYLKISDDTVANQKSQYFENLTFYNDGGGVFHSTTTDLTYKSVARFVNCAFNGGGQYIYTETSHLYFDNCTMPINGTEAVAVYDYVQFDNCSITRYGAASTMYLLAMLQGDLVYPEFHATNSTFDGTGATTFDMFHSGYWTSIWFDKCTVRNLAPPSADVGWIQVSLSFIGGKTGTDLTFGNDGEDMYLNSSVFWPTGGGKVVLTQSAQGFSTCTVVGVMTGVDLTVGTTGEMNCYDFEAIMNSYTALGMAERQVTQQTPTASRTVTTTVPRAGMRRTLILLTAGTTSYTYTFSTGFKTAGTLATGTVTAKRFVLEFVSDGTYLIETSRTGALA